jgi:hypothetical protein
MQATDKEAWATARLATGQVDWVYATCYLGINRALADNGNRALR